MSALILKALLKSIIYASESVNILGTLTKIKIENILSPELLVTSYVETVQKYARAATTYRKEMKLNSVLLLYC